MPIILEFISTCVVQYINSNVLGVLYFVIKQFCHCFMDKNLSSPLFFPTKCLVSIEINWSYNYGSISSLDLSFYTVTTLCG